MPATLRPQENIGTPTVTRTFEFSPQRRPVEDQRPAVRPQPRRRAARARHDRAVDPAQQRRLGPHGPHPRRRSAADQPQRPATHAGRAHQGVVVHRRRPGGRSEDQVHRPRGPLRVPLPRARARGRRDDGPVRGRARSQPPPAPGFARPSRRHAAAGATRAGLRALRVAKPRTTDRRSPSPRAARPSRHPITSRSERPTRTAGRRTRSDCTKLSAVAGNPATPEDEADVGVTVSVSDVRDKATLADYDGRAAGKGHAPHHRPLQRQLADPSPQPSPTSRSRWPCRARRRPNPAMGGSCTVEYIARRAAPRLGARGQARDLATRPRRGATTAGQMVTRTPPTTRCSPRRECSSRRRAPSRRR